jgi:hypothetical protein
VSVLYLFCILQFTLSSDDIFEALQPNKLSQNLPFLEDLARTTPMNQLEDMPILHHAFNLYFGSKSLDERKVLVKMLQVC